jgi:hypothetical protein
MILKLSAEEVEEVRRALWHAHNRSADVQEETHRYVAAEAGQM